MNPEYILMKELRKKYRKKYRFLNISIDRHKHLYMKVQQNRNMSISFSLSEDGVMEVNLSGYGILKVKDPEEFKKSVTLANPHMITNLDRAVHKLVIKLVELERDDRFDHAEKKRLQVESIKLQIGHLTGEGETLEMYLSELRKEKNNAEV